MRSDLRSLANDRAVDEIDDAVRLADERRGMGQENAAVGAFPLRIRRRKMLPDVTEACGTEQRVRNGVEDHVGIAMAGKAAVVRQFNAADPDRPFTRKGMDVKAHAGPADQPGCQQGLGPGPVGA